MGLSEMDFRRRELLIATGIWLVSSEAAIAAPSIRRRLTLKNEHTGETFDGPYRDEAEPLPQAMSELAMLLRDHHADKVGPVEVGTLDFLADVLAAVGQSKATILSAFRSPETNSKLAETTFGVAEHSQHLLGRALDVAFDRRLADAVRAALMMRRGGVGWYPRSRFIHLDTGPARCWQVNHSGLTATLRGQPARRPVGQPPTVEERMALHRSLARRQFLARH